MEYCWVSGSGTESYTMTGYAASLSAQLTVPLPTGLISLVSLLFHCLPIDYFWKVVLPEVLNILILQCVLQKKRQISQLILPLCPNPVIYPSFPHPCQPSIQTPAPYSIRNLSESSLTQYELDSKSYTCLYDSLLLICLHVISFIILPQNMPFV